MRLPVYIHSYIWSRMRPRFRSSNLCTGRIPVGIDDYKELIGESYHHVDKSMLIKAFLDENAKAALITRPRRFGKTLNMSMLYYFFSNRNIEENRQLFIGKKIESSQTNKKINCMELQGRFPTIFLTFKNIRARNFEDAKQQIAINMSQTYTEHRYLVDSEQLYSEQKKYFQKILARTATEAELQCSLEFLSQCLYQCYSKKVIILLDEYDTPFHAALTSSTPYHEMLSNFMKILIGSTFKGNSALEKGLLTGILKVSLMDLFSGAHSIPVMSMLTSEYAEFFGFTPSETQYLMKTHAAGASEAEVSSRIDTVTKWYNGYLIGNITLYNPWSVISYLYRNCTPGIYWNASGGDSVLEKSLFGSSFNMKTHLVNLLSGEDVQVVIDERTVFADLTRSEGALWGLMLYSGYLKIIGDNENLEDREYRVAIPNLEVKQAYKKMVRDWFLSIGESAYHQLFNSLQTGNLEAFRQLLENYLDQTVSYHDLGKKTLEKVYHVMFLGMFFTLGGKYTVDSNKEYGLGRYDIILIPKDKSKPGYIFEFKATDNASKLAEEVVDALEQITEARYSTRLQQEGIINVYHVAIAFCGKEMQMNSKLHHYQHQPVILTSSTTTIFRGVAALPTSDACKDEKRENRK